MFWLRQLLPTQPMHVILLFLFAPPIPSYHGTDLITY
uniref:Uncharacterized protein n=1 Tax=Arundo donax TaxID=35708 RepID=A0A0A9BDB2_ARUDO